MEARPDGFGAAVMRTYNSFLLPMSADALVGVESGAELGRLGIDPAKVEARPEGFGTAAMRT